MPSTRRREVQTMRGMRDTVGGMRGKAKGRGMTTDRTTTRKGMKRPGMNSMHFGSTHSGTRFVGRKGRTAGGGTK